jgi:hypothetical protein
MAEIRGRGCILASQLFLSTTENKDFADGKNLDPGKTAEKCTIEKNRMDGRLNRIAFRCTL